MGVTTTKTNKPFNPRAQDQSPKGFNRAKLYSGKALDFDGVNDVVNITTDDVDLQEFSVVQYVNLGATAASKIFYSNYAPTGNLGFATGISDSTANVPKFYTKGTSSNTLFGSFALNAGEWYQIVATYDGATKKIYVNGVLDTSVAFSDTILYTNATNQIGALSGGTAQALDGQLSNTKIFNTALTAAQVADLYNNPEKVVPTGVDNTALKLWLPMMEGAGTTAYDGSGNGNHGTISGATYVNGVGAPVSQSAVMDWNKGTNLLFYSEELNQSSKWFVSNSSVTANDTTAPDGTQTADKVAYTATANGTINQQVDSLDTSSNYTTSVWIKGDANYTMKFGFYSPAQLADINITTEWQRFEYTATPSGATRYPQITNDAGGVKTIYVWGWQLEKASTAGPYVRTGATAQTSPVLLPQGLTTGRDITGVNLFENVRKQGALNLDGNSWAEVHDNASLDITSAITLEAWVKWDSADSDKGILGRYETTGDKRSIMLVHHSTGALRLYTSPNGSTTYNVTNTQTLTDGEWYHIVGTSDGSTLKIYVNAQTPDSSGGSTIYANDIPLEIGRYNQDDSKSTSKPIAQPRIYNRALTAEEVQRSYDSGKNIFTNS